MIRQTKRWIRDRMKQDTKKVMIAKIVESPLIFNAVARENRYRLWGASRDLSKVMARKIDDDQIEKIKWFKTIMLDGDNIKVAVVWSVEPEEFDEIRERFYAYRDEILNLTML